MKKKHKYVPIEMTDIMLAAKVVNFTHRLEIDIDQSDLPKITVIEVLKKMTRDIEDEFYKVDLNFDINDIEIKDTDIKIDFNKGIKLERKN